MSEAIERDLRGTNNPGPAAKLGAELRAARQTLGWQIPDLANSLRIRQVYLEAIEAGRMSELPGTTYALGFVRTYATALGLQGEQVASRFRAESAEANIRPALSFPAPVPQRGVPAGALMLVGLLILAGAYSGWYYVSEHQRTPAETVPPIPDHLLPPAAEKPTPSPQVASILPNAAPPAAQPPAPVGAVPAAVQPAPNVSSPPAGMPNVVTPQPSASGPTVQALPPPSPTTGAVPQAAEPALPAGTRVVLKASADAWITVKQKGGPALYSKLMHAGDVWPVPADKSSLTLTTGNAGGTEIDVDGKAIASLGVSGMVRRDLPLDPEVLKSGNFPPPAARVRPRPVVADPASSTE